MRNIEDYGNKLTIVGFVVGNGEETEHIFFPDQDDILSLPSGAVFPTEEELQKIFYQLDTLQITNSQKVVLRKSQRNIDQNISFQVFRRDGFRCVYCGEEHKALTVDHLVLWEEMGDSVPDNLVTACKKCNHTRGNMQLPEFLETDYYKRVSKETMLHPNDIQRMKDKLLNRYEIAKQLPLRKPRSR